MSNELRAAALRILNGENLSVTESNKILGLDKAKRSWYITVDSNSWPGIKAKLLAENPNYRWPAGTLLSDVSMDIDPTYKWFVFCKGDDTLWQGDNEDYIKTMYPKREL